MRTKQELFKQLSKSWEVYKTALNRRLKPTYVRLLYHRLFRKKSFKELSFKFEIPIVKVKNKFELAVNQIRESIDEEFAKEIEVCNAFIKAEEKKKKYE